MFGSLLGDLDQQLKGTLVMHDEIFIRWSLALEGSIANQDGKISQIYMYFYT